MSNLQIAVLTGNEKIRKILFNRIPLARDILRMYRLRWRIEDWRRILKSGCKAEEVAFRTAERIKRAAAINAVIAWRRSPILGGKRRTWTPA